MNATNQKETQIKFTKNLLDMIILQHLEKQSMHGYQLLTSIRKDCGVYFGPSTIYPLLGLLEKKGVVQSAWNMTTERPRKIFYLTQKGKELLNATENSLLMICQKVCIESPIKTHFAQSITEECEIHA